MNLTTKTTTSTNRAFDDRTTISKLSYLLKACESSRSLIICIYLVEKNQFVYCNKKLKELLGENHDTLIQNGWDFWFSMVDQKELESTKNQLHDFLVPPYIHSSLTLRYHITNCCGKNLCLRHEIQLHQLEQHFLAINYFFDVSDKIKIEHCFENNAKSNSSRFTKKKKITISPREKQVLTLIADGFSSKEIADMLFISNHTAVSHRKNLIEKFQVKNTAHLIKKASAVMSL